MATFEQPLAIEDIPELPALDRDGALARLDGATPNLERLLAAVLRDADLTTTLEHRYFGTINLKAILLITAWHEQGHAAQIERLTT